MLASPEFSSLIVSRPGSRARLLARARSLAFAAALYAAGLACLLVAPLFMIEMVQSPKADVPTITFHPLSSRGDNQPMGALQNGVRNGSRHSRQQKNDSPAQAHRNTQPLPNPLAPPESQAPEAAPESSGTDEGPQWGDPNQHGSRTEGPPSKCADCTGPGLGPGSDDGPEEIYSPDIPGLTPPQLDPSTRALPKYPELPRKAGVQGTVILLAVIEKDGSVGRIEVVRSSDQRWGFDLAAITALKQWRYRPAMLGERPVAAYITVMVEFSLSR